MPHTLALGLADHMEVASRSSMASLHHIARARASWAPRQIT